MGLKDQANTAGTGVVGLIDESSDTVHMLHSLTWLMYKQPVFSDNVLFLGRSHGASR